MKSAASVRIAVLVAFAGLLALAGPAQAKVFTGAASPAASALSHSAADTMPEPASVGAMGLSLLAAGVLRRRKRTQDGR